MLPLIEWQIYVENNNYTQREVLVCGFIVRSWSCARFHQECIVKTAEICLDLVFDSHYIEGIKEIGRERMPAVAISCLLIPHYYPRCIPQRQKTRSSFFTLICKYVRQSSSTVRHNGMKQLLQEYSKSIYIGRETRSLQYKEGS